MTRTAWQLKERKSKDMRSFGLPTDNANTNHRVYGDVDIALPAPKLVKNGNERPKEQRIVDAVIRQRVDEISKSMHTSGEPGKVRGILSFRGPAPPISCPICSKIFHHGGNLQNHLVGKHHKDKKEAENIASNAQNKAIATGIETYHQKTRDPNADFKLQVEELVNSIQALHVDSPTKALPPFTITESMREKAKLAKQCFLVLDMETTSGYSFNKGAMCQIAVGHEFENFEVRHTLVDPSPYIQPIISHCDCPYQWSSRCCKLHRIRPSDVTAFPNLKETLEAFYQWATVDGAVEEVIILAHNAAFDRSRMQAMMRELCPHLDFS